MAPLLPEIAFSDLTEARVFGRIRAPTTVLPAPAGSDPPLVAGCLFQGFSRRISCKSVRSFGLRPSPLSNQPARRISPRVGMATTPAAQSGRTAQPAPATVRLRGSAL